jgi:hypothetical protein
MPAASARPARPFRLPLSAEAALAIAILTDANPSDPYGRETITGIADRLLGQ